MRSGITRPPKRAGIPNTFYRSLAATIKAVVTPYLRYERIVFVGDTIKLLGFAGEFIGYQPNKFSSRDFGQEW